jgi:hypothetical protein
MNELLNQARESIKSLIAESPSIASFSYVPLVNNGFGTMIPDPSGTAVTYTERVRLSHEQSGVQTNETTPAGLGSSYSMFILTEYGSRIYENMIITTDGVKWKVGVVDKLKKFGGVYGLQAPLTKVV